MLPHTHATAAPGAPKESPPSKWQNTLSFVPNFSDWRPADIVLVKADNTLISRGIKLAQQASLNKKMRLGAEFTHAALYIGDGQIIDITYDDSITERCVWDYCVDREVIVRRVPGLTVQDEDAVVAHALYLRQQNYSYSRWQAALSKMFSGVKTNPTQLFCSTFVAACYMGGPNPAITLDATTDHTPLYPAILHSHSDLVSVHTEWRERL